MTSTITRRAYSIFVTTQEIAFARDNGYLESDHWAYVKDRFKFEHGVLVIDRNKLKLEPGPNMMTMKITGYVGNGLTPPQE